jgi:hypothetical protein
LGNFQLSEEARSDVLRMVLSLGIGASDAFAVSAGLCERISTSLDAYFAEADRRISTAELAREFRLLTRLILAADPMIGLIRRHIVELSDPAVGQFVDRALRLSSQVPACSAVGLDLRCWAKSAIATDLVQVLRLCLVEGGAMVPGRRRPNGRRSAGHFDAVVFGRGAGMPKPKSGRPADDAEVRLIAHLAVDWMISAGVQPEGGRDGHSAFSALVHSVFSWIGIEAKAIYCLRAYWRMISDNANSSLGWDQF